MLDQFKKIETLDELIEEAKEPTETKPTQAEQQPETTEQVDKKNDEDFEEVEEVEEITPKKLKSNADFILGMVNVAQQTTFGFGVKYAYKKKLKKLYGDDALERAEMVDDISKEALTDTDKGILKINAKLEKVMESLPMTDEEKQMWYPVIEDYVRKNHGKIPENFFSYLALCQSLGSRVLAVLTF